MNCSLGRPGEQEGVFGLFYFLFLGTLQAFFLFIGILLLVIFHFTTEFEYFRRENNLILKLFTFTFIYILIEIYLHFTYFEISYIAFF